MVRTLLMLMLIALAVTSCKRPEYATGEAVFRGECAKCHKLNGQGGTKGPDLTGILHKKDEAYFRSYTLDPRSIKSDGTMPPAKISDRELELLVQYLRGLPPASEQQGH
jgi:mono/diheme cytochrome c family protein